MTGEASLRRARLCAFVSAVLFGAVLIVGGVRGASEPPAVSVPMPPEYEIAAFAADHNSVREEETAQLMGIASDPTLSEEVRTAAARRLMQLRVWMEQEAALCEVLCARGYEVPVITVHENSVNVIVRTEALTGEEAGIILELVTRETGVSGGNVKIIPIN